MIYKAKYILPMNGSVIEHGEVLVREGRIAAVGTELADMYPDEKVRDLGQCAILPGFVNAHSHIEPTFRRNTLDALNLWDWIEELGFRKNAAPSRDLLRFSALVGAAECALSGITCVGDCSFSGAAVEAMTETGLRGVVYLEMFGQSAGDQFRALFDEKLELVRELQTTAPERLKIGISPHSVYTSDRGTFELCVDACSRLGLPIAVHAAETAAETDYLLHGVGPIAEMRQRMGYEPMVAGLTPVKYLGEIGLLREGICLAHCVHVSKDEIDFIAKSGASVAHCARSNAYLGSGIAPIVELCAAGATVGLGTDSAASCMRLDFFEEMRFALGMQRAYAKEAGVLTAKDVLKLATIGGARALGLAEHIGTLEPGKYADFIAVNISRMLPMEDIFSAVISRAPSDVVLTVVDGVEVTRDRAPVLVDLEECRARLAEYANGFRTG